jgi:hypothetical protein
MHFVKASRDRCLYTLETDAKACFEAFYDFWTDPQNLTRLPANPALSAARMYEDTKKTGVYREWGPIEMGWGS